jgi:hypothetical protein
MEKDSDSKLELLKFEKKTKNQQRFAYLIAILFIVIFGYTFIPFFYNTAVYKFTDSEELVSGTFWYYEGKKWTLEVKVPKSKYDYYDSMPINDVRTYNMDTILLKFVTSDDDTIVDVANALEKMADGEGYNRKQKAEFVLGFVQSKNYKKEIGNYIRFPFQTLVESGDCEDSSVLTASLLKALDYEVVFAETTGHIAVGVYIDGKGNLEHGGKNYYYMETTGEGWRLGEIPPEYKSTDFWIIPIKAEPMENYI